MYGGLLSIYIAYYWPAHGILQGGRRLFTENWLPNKQMMIFFCDYICICPQNRILRLRTRPEQQRPSWQGGPADRSPR